MKKSGIFCTSLDIAHEFGKRHDNVLADIRKLKCSEDFFSWNFQEASYRNRQNKLQPMSNMTQEGYTFLTIGYAGRKAAPVKEEIINSGKIN